MPNLHRIVLLPVLLASVLLLLPGCASANPPSGLGSALPSRMPQSSGAGGTFYVDGAAGSDSASGSSSAPWRTINKALSTVPLSGSVIKVRPGTYTSTGTNYAVIFNRKGNPSDPVTLAAETPGTVKLRNGDLTRSTLGMWIFNASGLRVQGLDILMTAQQTNISVNSALVENSDRVEFTRNTFQESGGFQVRGGKVDGAAAEDVWVYGNTFRPSGTNPYAQATGNSHRPDTYSGSKGSHYVYAGQVGDTSLGFSYRSGAERFVVANNVFVGTAAGRHVELGPQARGSFVVNNTFFGNHAGEVIGWNTGAAYAGEGVVLFANTDSSVPAATRDNVITNNVFADLNGHSVYGSGPSESGNVVQRNLSWDIDNAKGLNGDANDDYAERYGSSVLFGEGTGNLPRADPRFANPGAFDMRLLAGSPAIGKADPAYAPAEDREGRARDGSPDLGALEHGGNASAPLAQPAPPPPTSSQPAGTAPATTAPLTPVAGSPPPPAPSAGAPVNVVRPGLLGTTRTGNALRCARGTWAGSSTLRYAYRWTRRRGTRTSTIRGASANRYRLRQADRGAAISCVVAATNDGGRVVAYSRASRRIR